MNRTGGSSFTCKVSNLESPAISFLKQHAILGHSRIGVVFLVASELIQTFNLDRILKFYHAAASITNGNT
jgi:hypothetical protein